MEGFATGTSNIRAYRFLRDKYRDELKEIYPNWDNLTPNERIETSNTYILKKEKAKDLVEAIDNAYRRYTGEIKYLFYVTTL